MKEIKITNPFLITLYYYIRDSTNENLPESLTSKLTLEKDKENHKVFKGLFSDIEYQLEWLKHYDTVVLRLSVCKNGEFSPKTWLEQLQSLNQIIQNMEIPNEKFLGSSIVYWGIVKNLENEIYDQVSPTVTAFGNLWKHSILNNERKIEYILLTPEDMEEKTKKYLLFANDQGFIKIESHFHKVNTEIKEYNGIRGKLMGDIKELDVELITLLNSLRGQVIKEQQENLRILTPKYTAFVQRVSLVLTQV